MGRIKASQESHGRKKLYLSSHRRNRRKSVLKTILQKKQQLVKVIDDEVDESHNEQCAIASLTDSNKSSSTCTSNVFTNNCSPKEIQLEGRRIVDIGYFLDQILNEPKHEPFDCTITDMYPIKELREGLQDKITLKCRMCGIEKKIELNDNRDHNVDINTGIVLGIVSTGIGYSTCEELMSTINIPFMTQTTYQKYHEKVADTIHETALASMLEAGAEEAELARKFEEISKDGIPHITVIADGAWSKRSYNINYDAASGVACIIGQRTGKILFLGIRNKYCCVCAQAETKKINPLPNHACYKNWNSTSTSMESDIIVEGFRQSIQMHGVRFLQLVGDGDSSVTKKLLETRPYGNLLVQKIECKNHLLRNFCAKIREICNRKRSNSTNSPVSPMLRKFVGENSARLRTAIKKALLFRINEEKSFSEKVTAITKDLKNVPSHVFGEHKICEELGYFRCEKRNVEKNFVPEMQECGLYQDIEICFNRLIYHASSLIRNMDNNQAEQYNSIICKFVGGKRINFTLRRSYETRCEAAAISRNTSGDYHRILQKAMTNKSPSGFKKKYIDKMKRRRLMQRKNIEARRKLFVSRKKTIALPDEDYGLDTHEPDMSVEEFQQKKDTFLSELKKSKEEILSIEIQTRGQGDNPMWRQERSVRLTASNFGSICKMRKKTSCENKVKELLYSKFFGNEHTKYGTEHEPFAIKCFEEKYNLKVVSCGFFIDPSNFIFGASPDGLIADTAIIEIKCPSTIKKMTPTQGILNKIIRFATLDDDGNLRLKESHNYYYQVQGQLHITNREFCYFVVWSPFGMLVEQITRNRLFWENKMAPPLEIFYHNCILPELIDPRHPRGLKIRNPPRCSSPYALVETTE